MQNETAYRIKEATTYTTLTFSKVNQYRVQSQDVVRGGRFFVVSKPGAEPAPLSFN